MSEDRLLTTHVGSLPRPEALLTAMRDKAEARPYDAALLDRTLAQAVSEIVRKQVDIGIDVVSDGEFSKPSYATYVGERLSGFGGLLFLLGGRARFASWMFSLTRTLSKLADTS